MSAGLKASDIMSSPVITVAPQHGRVVGIVSEADLLHRHEIGTDRTMPAGPGWLRLFSADSSADETPGRMPSTHATS